MSDISMERLRVISMYDTTEPEYWEHTSEAIRKAVREKVMMARELIRLREAIAEQHEAIRPFATIKLGRTVQPEGIEFHGETDLLMRDFWHIRDVWNKRMNAATRCRALLDAEKEGK